MNGIDYQFHGGGLTTVLTEGEQYLGISEFGSSSLVDESYDIGLKSELESTSWQLQDTAADKKLRERFNNLAETWEKDTVNLSSAQEIILHPAYQRIIGMGPIVIPLILKRLTKTPNFWFWALRALTDVEPVRERERGFLPAMTEAWLRWGEENGYC